jgi:hypothetical protein
VDKILQEADKAAEILYLVKRIQPDPKMEEQKFEWEVTGDKLR